MTTQLNKKTLLEQAATWDLPWLLLWMANGGTHVSLDWSDDEHAWVCSWVTGGRRYTGRDDGGSMGSPTRAAQAAAMAGIKAEYKHWDADYIPVPR